ncbi:ATP-binding protein [Paenibacillus solisilvae]|uniref:histidine kinase n=1 Tax=Paenibacillus solisilvae TaxID=2486751 RepID=A0ABW0W4E3_9BACL
MWKQLLFQMIVALLPVFTFQLWFDHAKSKRFISIVISFLCGGAAILAVAASSDFHGFNLDFRFIPLLTGSLYGGVTVFLAVSAVYLFYQLVWAGSVSDWVGIIGFAVLCLPVTYMASRLFMQTSRERRKRVALLLTSLSLIIIACSFIALVISEGIKLSLNDYYQFTLHLLLYLVTMWASVSLIEDYMERQALPRQLKNVSDKYRVEVQKLQQFIEETPLCVIFVNESGIITHINEMAIHILQNKIGGRSRQELIGQPFMTMYENIDKDVVGRLLQQALNGHKTSTEIVQEQGKILLKTGFCIRDMENNTITGAAIIAHDITELNRLRDEMGKMERLSMVGQMAASITHEIRNPMAVIRGFVQLMRERSPDHQQEYFRIVMDELDRANSIINDFLSLAQNRLIEKESSSLHDIVNEILPLLWSDANMRGQLIELELSEDIPLLMLNEKEMKQLLLNLARNGMEAMDQNGILRIRTKVFPGRVELRVIDNGCGIPQEKQEHLFEPFYTTKMRGTGLGLPLCLSIVERHGGQISVESIEGKGTTFIVAFSLQHSAEHEAAASSEWRGERA